MKLKYVFAMICAIGILTTVTMIVTFVDTEQKTVLIECE